MENFLLSCCCSIAKSCLTLYDSMNCSMPGFLPFTTSQSFIKLTLIKSVRPSHYLILSSPSPPAFNLSQHQGLFQRVGSLHQVAKVNWSFSFSISPSSEYSGLISFKIGWFDLLSVQEALKSLFSLVLQFSTKLNSAKNLKADGREFHNLSYTC